jgi:hypothetical protein
MLSRAKPVFPYSCFKKDCRNNNAAYPSALTFHSKAGKAGKAQTFHKKTALKLFLARRFTQSDVTRKLNSVIG